MGMFGALAGRVGGRSRPRVEAERAGPSRLVVKTRHVLVADVIAIDEQGRRETLASGLDEEGARQLFRELTGRPWTRIEAMGKSTPPSVWSGKGRGE
jgi:hypothetical protein